MAQRVNLSFDEQEEILNYLPRQSSDRMSAYSCTPAGIRYYQGLLGQYPDEVKLIKADRYGIEVELPASWYRRPKKPNKRILSEDQRAEAAARLAAAREKKRKGGEKR